MRDTRAINLLTLLIIVTTGAIIWALSAGAEGPLTGIAAWLLFAALCVLMMLYSFRTRWYLHGLVRSARLESKHEATAPTHSTQKCPEPTRT